MNAEKRKFRSERHRLSKRLRLGFGILLAISLLVFLNAPYHSFLRKFNSSEIKHDDGISLPLILLIGDKVL